MISHDGFDFHFPGLPGSFLCPWDSPGKNTGVGCHALLQETPWARDWTHISYVSCIGRQVLYHKCHLGNPITGNVEHPFMCLLAICLFVFFAKMFSQICSFKIVWFGGFLLLSCMSSVCIFDINPYQIYDLQIFLQFGSLPFHFDGFLCYKEDF